MELNFTNLIPAQTANKKTDQQKVDYVLNQIATRIKYGDNCCFVKNNYIIPELRKKLIESGYRLDLKEKETGIYW